MFVFITKLLHNDMLYYLNDSKITYWKNRHNSHIVKQHDKEMMGCKTVKS